MTRTRNHRGEDLLCRMSDAHLVAEAAIRAQRPRVWVLEVHAGRLFADFTDSVAQNRHDGEKGGGPVGHRLERRITRRRGDDALSSVG